MTGEVTYNFISTCFVLCFLFVSLPVLFIQDIKVTVNRSREKQAGKSNSTQGEMIQYSRWLNLDSRKRVFAKTRIAFVRLTAKAFHDNGDKTP